jgi:hypothetical protein
VTNEEDWLEPGWTCSWCGWVNRFIHNRFRNFECSAKVIWKMPAPESKERREKEDRPNGHSG